MRLSDLGIELQMIFLKRLVNVPMRVLDRLLPEPQVPRYPATLLFARLFERYRLAYLNDLPSYEPNDRNFERVLRVAYKVVGRLADWDRFYRMWLGVTFVVCAEELERLLKECTPEQLRDWIKTQWKADLSLFENEVLLRHKQDFFEVALCDYMGNVSRIPRTKIMEEKRENDKLVRQKR